MCIDLEALKDDHSSVQIILHTYVDFDKILLLSLVIKNFVF